MPLVKPTLSFELGLTAGFHDLLSAVAWTDITNYVVSWGTGRGREPRKPPSHFDPGAVNLTLNNRDRRFDPTNTAGPYWPNLKPARVRLRVTANWPNRLRPNDASLESSIGGWEATLNCAIARSPAQAADGASSLALTSSAAGVMGAAVGSATTANRIECVAGEQVTAFAYFRPAATVRNVRVHVNFYDAAGGSVSVVASTNTAEVLGAWTQCTPVTTTVPAGAVSMGIAAVVDTPAAGGEVHYVDKISLNRGTDTAWTPPLKVFTGYVKRWPPEWTASATSTVKITAVDAMGAPLNLAQVYASMWETVVRHDRPKVWLRLDEGSGTVAVDSTPNRLNASYQGGPTLGQASLVDTVPDGRSVRFVSGSRASLPYKSLLADYPFSVECWFTCEPMAGVDKVIIAAFDGPSLGFRQEFALVIPSTGGGAGRVLALVANPYPTGTQVVTLGRVDDGFHHHLVWVCASSTNHKLYLDGTDVTFISATAAHAFPNDLVTGYGVGNNPAATFGDFRFGYGAGDLLDEVAIYDTALSASRIDKHYAAGLVTPALVAHAGYLAGRLLDEADWPGDRVIDTGVSVLADTTTAGSVVANLQKIEESEQGALFVDEAGRVVLQDRHAMLRAPYTTSQVTLGQGVGDQPYEPPVTWGNDDAELYNQATGARVGGPTYTVDDLDSQAAYGVRALSPATGLLNTDDGEVVDLLTYRVQKYAEPVSSVRQVRLHPAAVPTLYPYVLGLGLRSRITVKVAPPGGGPVFSQDSHIERITHEVNDQGDWWTTWDVSAADATNYLVLDDATRGVLDAGNVVAL